MIPMLVAAVWILVLALVAGLCVAARTGDVAQQLTDAPAAGGWDALRVRSRGQAEHPAITARASGGGSRASAESDASVLHSGGVAA
jgi:hypothetical protein